MTDFFEKLLNNLSQRVLTLKFRLMALITIVLLIAVGTPLLFLINQLDKNYREFTINLIETTSQVVYQSIYDGMMENDDKSIQNNISIMSMEPNIKVVRIIRPTGEILFSSREDEINENIQNQKDEVFSSLEEPQETFKKTGNIYSHLHPIYVQEECTACHQNKGTVIAVMNVQLGLTQSEQIFASTKRLTIFSAIIIVVILWIILNFLYQGQIESRLRVIINGFNQLAKGDLNFKIKMPGRHELAALAQKFNQTVQKLKEAKEKEDQFVQENLERADRLVTLGEVAAEIAHEVNNPASIMFARAEFLKGELEENENKGKYLDDLNIIIQQTKKIAEITRSILHYARKLPQTFSDTDLNKVIEQSIDVLKPRINKKGVRVKFHRDDRPNIVHGNSIQLEQVFCNLINNSIDLFPNDNGEINIKIYKLLKGNKLDKYQIVYQDNGPGVPSEYHDKIFSPFFTTKEDGKGTGLGLFIARNIITNHQGKICLSSQRDRRSEKNEGATFVIEMEAKSAKN